MNSSELLSSSLFVGSLGISGDIGDWALSPKRATVSTASQCLHELILVAEVIARRPSRGVVLERPKR